MECQLASFEQGQGRGHLFTPQKCGQYRCHGVTFSEKHEITKLKSEKKIKFPSNKKLVKNAKYC